MEELQAEREVELKLPKLEEKGMIIESEREIVSFEDVTKVYKTSGVKNFALDHVTLNLEKGKALSIVGESGSGKTTLGLASLGLLSLSGGSVKFHGKTISKMSRKEYREFRSKTHMIFQDPYSSLNPYNTIFRSVAAPLFSFHKEMSTGQIKEKVVDTLEKVGLSPGESYLDIYPRSLSGGQRQRVSIARAIINNPEFIVSDEATSMLDVSITSTVINTLKMLKNEMGFSMLYISHEIATSRYLGDQMAVMNLGRVVEQGDPVDVTAKPMHPYTDLLISSFPKPGSKIVPSSKPIVPHNLVNGGIKGCTFAYMCKYKTEICEKERPTLRMLRPNHWVACFNPLA